MQNIYTHYIANSILNFFFSCRRDFRLLTGEPDPSSPTPQPVLWFAEEVQPQVRLHEHCATIIILMTFCIIYSVDD